MIKKLLIPIFYCLIIAPINIYAQAPYGHEWIEFNQPHFKIPIINNSIYRLSYNFIISNCPEIANANPNEICIYNNGKQIPIYVSWSSGSITSSDYIEFLGTKINGDVDEKLFTKPDFNLNPYVGLFKDTNYYFLTLRSGITNERITNTTNDTTTTSDPYPTYCFAKSLLSFKTAYSDGRRYYYTNLDYLFSAAYDDGEGWGTANYANNTIPTPNFISDPTIQSELQFRIFGRNETSHKLEFKINTNKIGESQFVGSKLMVDKFLFPSNYINSASATLNITKLIANTHDYALGSATLKYPRNFNFTSLGLYTFFLPTSTSNSRITITGYNSSNTIYLYNVSKKLRQTHIASSGHRFLIPSNNSTDSFLIFHEGIISSVTTSIRVSFTDLLSKRGNFIILTDKSISIDSLGSNVIEEYKAYKESTEGGGFQVVVAYVDELSTLFGYGIPKHPIAIKKYLQWAHSSWPSPTPSYALIIGKGYNVNGLFSSSVATYNQNLIPGYGHIASDYLYTTADTSLVQYMPIGRISATSPYIVRNYLNKLKTYNLEYNATAPNDQNPSKKEYMKWAIHLGGGQGAEQQSEFRANLKSFESKFRSPSIGGKVFSIFKNGPDISEDVTSVDLTNRINKGVGLITFFGHSSTNIFDVGIGNPAEFSNKGKYPVFLANGCYSGYVFSAAPSYSENFINLPEKGAIGFVATSNFALDVAMYQYCDEFYNQMLQPSYNTSLGNLVLNTSKKLLGIYPNLNYLGIVNMEYNIDGDPSIMMSHYAYPDYYIDNNSAIAPTYSINNTIDSFPLNLIVQNLGKAISQTIKVKIERTNGTNKAIYEKTISAPFFKDTYTFYIPTIDANLGVGLNSFDIKVESDEQIAEISEFNNEIKSAVSIVIESEDIIQIFPYEYSIVGMSPIKLTSMVTTSFPKYETYRIQLDTSELFNSSFLKSHILSTSENVISWTPAIGYSDSLVYYWRIGKDTTTGKPMKWTNSSFIYISNQPDGGWNQSHYFQYTKNNYSNINIDNSRKFKFVNDVKNIFIRTDGSNSTYEVEWYLNSARQAVLREAGRMAAGMMILWIDGKSGIAKQSLDSTIGGSTWGSNGSIMFGYPGLPREGFVFPDTGSTPASHPRPNTRWSTIITDFINQIPDGDYVIIYSNKRPFYNKWDPILVNSFLSNGFTNINTLVDTIIKAPFIFGYRKNVPTYTPFTKIGTDYTTKTSAELFISGSWKNGKVISPKIGPAQKWNTLSYKLDPSENPSKDTTSLDLIGYTKSGIKTILASFQSLKLDTPLNWIDPNIYTHLQLIMHSEDNIDRTPTQIKYWRIYYDDIGEVAVNNSNAGIPDLKDTIENGDVFKLKMGVESLFNKSFDSITLKLNVSQGSQNKTIFTKIAPINGYQYIANEKIISKTDYFVGENNVTYEINPLDFGNQKEKYQINNYGKSKFFVKSDLYNPLLDVTFDGIHIIQNELVSNIPLIKITLKDENKFLLLDDTALIKLYLKYPDGTLTPVFFSQSNVTYTLAQNADKNIVEISFKPILTDGLYSIVIQDADKSGNSSNQNGSYNYKIGFRVITKNQISQFFNYPNPFTTSTQFIFSLTGSKIPDYIKIQIINIRGQVVKEILKEDLGPLKLGLNRTSYTWNGTDQYGDLLANGVYLYKVVVKDDGKDFPIMDDVDFKNIFNSNNNLNQYFNNGWGKMVIIR